MSAFNKSNKKSKSKPSTKKFGGPKRSDGPKKFGGKSSGFNKMHSGICGKCKSSCEVPFKPSKGQPVLCAKCFKGKDSFSKKFGQKSFDVGSKNISTESAISKVQFNLLNQKLDKILDLLTDENVD